MRLCPECGFETSDELEVCPSDSVTLLRVDERPDPLVGQTLDGRYRVLGRLGRGGMGTVYDALQEPIGRPVALKVLRDELARDSQAIERFLREAQVVSRLRHAHTVTLYDFGQSADGRLFIAMERMAGERLDEMFRGEPPPLEEVLELLEQVCQALAEAHGLGIVHRDLKPENIYVERVGSQRMAKVLDFGIAKVRDASESLTRTGRTFGTPAYMSPEQAQGLELDERSDLYALGVLLHELVTGRLPFEARHPMGVAMAHILEPAPKLQSRSRYGRLPARLDALASRLLAKRTADRPASAEEVERELAAIRRELGSGPQVSVETPVPAVSAPLEEPASAAPAEARGLPSVPPRMSHRAGRPRWLGPGLTGLVLALAFWGGERLLSPPVERGSGGALMDQPAAGPLEPLARQAQPALAPPSQAASLAEPVDGRPPAVSVGGPEPLFAPREPEAQRTAGGPRVEDDDDPVHIALELDPVDAAVYLGEEPDPVCQGAACAELRLPRGTTPVDLRVARRRYREARVRLVPDGPQDFAVRLERASRGEEEGEDAPLVVVRDEPPADTTPAEAAPGVNHAASEPAQSSEPRNPLMRPVTLP
jgi:predicted Ser/Thr protein kinase